jgi:hypothetical protein
MIRDYGERSFSAAIRSGCQAFYYKKFFSREKRIAASADYAYDDPQRRTLETTDYGLSASAIRTGTSLKNRKRAATTRPVTHPL